MPSALAMTRSSGVVMNPRTRSALAPTYAVDTRTIGDVAARILAHAERANRLQAGDQDDQVDDDREDRPLDEEIGETHQLSSGFGARLLAGVTLLLTCTAAPFRSLNTPEVTTSSPGFTPSSTAT